jgi:hypothetical protein
MLEKVVLQSRGGTLLFENIIPAAQQVRVVCFLETCMLQISQNIRTCIMKIKLEKVLIKP